jgi:hypothetical protein
MISSSVRDHDAGFEELVSELVDAHVDTIELLDGRDDAATDEAHLEYHQALVRYSKQVVREWAGCCRCVAGDVELVGNVDPVEFGGRPGGAGYGRTMTLIAWRSFMAR